MGNEMTVGELLELGKEARAALEGKGYNSVKFEHVAVRDRSHHLTFMFYVTDDFQEHLEYNEKICSGSIFIHCDTIEEFYAKLTEWPSRTERELKVLLRQAAENKLVSENYISAAGREFYLDAVKRLEQYRLLEGPKVVEQKFENEDIPS